MQAIDEEILSARILMVDDNPSNVALLEEMLDEAGYTQLTSTTDSRQVEALCAAQPFDAILLDIRMPHLDGFQVMQQLRARQGNDYLPVLVITAQTDLETRRQALQCGAKDFITKPFEQWELLNRIRNLLETRVYFNRQRGRADALEEEVRHRTQEVRATQLEIIRRLGRAAEFKDNETGMHILRMSQCCQLLAHAAGLSEDFAELLLYATPMHDIGKIGIPDAILLKPGKLDPPEWEIMQKHAQIGGEIIGDHPSPLLRMASDIARCHHEKWDGSGYPAGLAGEQIPIEARVTSICDVFDALTSHRPYKQPWPPEEALAFLRDQTGRHFDPALITAFERIADEVIALRAVYSDLTG